MKKLVLGLFIICCMILPVQAMEYQLKELIPLGIETTISTNKFIYKDLYLSEKIEKGKTYFVFKGVKNISDEDRPVSIKIAFFDENRENIGVLNYCSSKDKTSSITTLKSKEEKSFAIEITDNYLADKKRVKDIKYVAVMDDNSNCNSSVYLDGVGRKVDELGKTDPNLFKKDDVGIMKVIYIVVGVVLVLLFLYKFLFTSSYKNMDGEDVRNGYKKYNKELKDQREFEAKVNPPVVEEPKKEKTDEVIAQEKSAQEEDKSGTDLHNLYK